ncbi:hypothetical protein H4219_001052 [Mycoemilia scoparia]|uniref:LITAF domain-containing protein n=1 Tax=Mycoemilia scoparia TaxID=417184 RepID=A0A9W8A1Z7_9FUNG|nr:hypothetical protein H4219_001052 [Mycoemilia scoparia]
MDMGNPENEKISFPTPEASNVGHPYHQTPDHPPAYIPDEAAKSSGPAPSQAPPVAAALSSPTGQGQSQGPTADRAAAGSNEKHEPGDFVGIISCPSCRQNVNPITKKEIGTKVLGWSVAIGIVFFPLMCIPCCIDSLKDTKYYCPKCNVCFNDMPKFLQPQPQQPYPQQVPQQQQQQQVI